jgi:hypothetical protein
VTHQWSLATLSNKQLHVGSLYQSSRKRFVIVYYKIADSKPSPCKDGFAALNIFWAICFTNIVPATALVKLVCVGTIRLYMLASQASF